MNSRVALFFTTLILLAAVSVGVFLWAQGYSLDRTSGKLEKTGMILTKSEPDGGKILVDGVLTSATNATLANLKPGTHKIRIEKEGFVAWQKDVEVKEQYVSEVSAVLIPLTPKLLPLTVSGVHNPALSSDGTRIAFFSQNGETPGIWVLPLSGRGLLNLSQSSPRLLLADQLPKTAFSSGVTLKWSPDDSEVLAQINRQGFYVIDVSQLPSSRFAATASAEPTENRWLEGEVKGRRSLLDKIKIDQGILTLALEPQTLWAQNGKRFVYKKTVGNLTEYHVYDLSDPLPVGGSSDYKTLITDKDSGIKVRWYSDSAHLILFSCQKTAGTLSVTPTPTPTPSRALTIPTTDVSQDVVEGQDNCREGTIEIIGISGDNRTQIYKGAAYSDQVFPSPDGSQIIILTSFNSEGEPNLYAISLR